MTRLPVTRVEPGVDMRVGKDGDWMRMKRDKNGAPHLKCSRCGGEYTVAVPLSLGILVAILTAFEKEHGGCKARPNSRR